MVVTGAYATGLPAQMQNGPSSVTSSSPATISGRVVNAITGLPVPRALVRFNGRSLLTGSEGKFDFVQVTESQGNLQVTKPGFYPSIDGSGSAPISWKAGQAAAALELRLYPEAIFTGTMVAPDGDPLPHVLISARRSIFDGSSHGWTVAGQTQTDSHGRFRLGVPPGDYKLESMYMPRANGSNEVVLPAIVPMQISSNTSDSVRIRSGEEQRFDLRPVVSRSYSVTATFDSGMGRGFPRITARSSNGGKLTLSVRASGSDTSGAAKFELPSGTYTLTASTITPEGPEQAETTVTVADHDVTGVVFHLAPVPSLPVEMLVEGATSDNQQPNLQQFGLTLENNQSDAEVLNSSIRLITQRDRTLAFTVPPGSYRLRARGNGAWYIKSASYGASDLLRQDLTMGPGVGGMPIRITVSNQTASVQGVCRLSGAPVDCWVYLIPTTPRAETVFIQRGNGAQGIYNYAHVPPGTYQAIAFEQRYSADYRDTATLAPFSSRVRTVTLNAGEKPTLDLDVVPAAEMMR